MPIKKQEFYEGAAFHLLASTGNIVGIISDPPFFILNGRLLVLLKYSTKGRSPWGFSFTPNEQQRLANKVKKFTAKIGLICSDDGVATLDYEDYLTVAPDVSGAVHISCYRDHGEHYEISGPAGVLKRKVAPSSWLRIFERRGSA